MPTYTTTSAPLPWMEPYLRDYMQRAQEVANTPFEQSPGTYTGPNDLLQAGWQMTANRAMQGSPEMSAARGQLTNTINGQFLGRQATQNQSAGVMNPYMNVANPYMGANNPYLQQSINDAQGDLARNYNLVNKPAWDKAMQQSGSFGNTGVAEMAQNDRNNLMQNMGRIGNDMRMSAYNQSANMAENQIGRQFDAGNQYAQNQFNAGQDYAGRQDAMGNLERGYQQSAMGLAPTFANQDYTDLNNLMSAGGMQQQFNQAFQNQQQQFFNERRQYPQQMLQFYGSALGQGNPGQTQTQQAPDPSTASQVLGGALTGAGIYNMLFR